MFSKNIGNSMKLKYVVVISIAIYTNCNLEKKYLEILSIEKSIINIKKGTIIF